MESRANCKADTSVSSAPQNNTKPKDNLKSSAAKGSLCECWMICFHLKLLVVKNKFSRDQFEFDAAHKASHFLLNSDSKRFGISVQVLIRGRDLKRFTLQLLNAQILNIFASQNDQISIYIYLYLLVLVFNLHHTIYIYVAMVKLYSTEWDSEVTK